MADKASKGFGYVPTKVSANGDERGYILTLTDWYDLYRIAETVVKNGASFGMYTSRDGNALCVSIAYDTQRAKYWIGPDDDARAQLARLRLEWNIVTEGEGIIDDIINTALRER